MLKYIINIPIGVGASYLLNELIIKGPLGELSRKIPLSINLSIENNTIIIIGNNPIQGTFRSLINNMIIGVTHGYNKSLRLEGVGYKVYKNNNSLIFNLGYSHEIIYNIPNGIQIEVIDIDKLEIKSNNKELLGKSVSEIRSLRKTNPYRMKGIYYKDEKIILKNTKKK